MQSCQPLIARAPALPLTGIAGRVAKKSALLLMP
jgi:hypothetical protein